MTVTDNEQLKTALTQVKSQIDRIAADEDELTAAVFRAFETGQFEISLTTHDGEAICTHEGVPIHARTEFGGVS